MGDAIIVHDIVNKYTNTILLDEGPHIIKLYLISSRFLKTKDNEIYTTQNDRDPGRAAINMLRKCVEGNATGAVCLYIDRHTT